MTADPVLVQSLPDLLLSKNKIDHQSNVTTLVLDAQPTAADHSSSAIRNVDVHDHVGLVFTNPDLSHTDHILLLCLEGNSPPYGLLTTLVALPMNLSSFKAILSTSTSSRFGHHK